MVIEHPWPRLHEAAAVKLQNFQHTQSLCRSGQLVSHGILRFVEPNTLKFVILRVILVNVLDRGSAKPSMNKNVNQGGGFSTGRNLSGRN